MKSKSWIVVLSLILVLAIAGFAFAQAGPGGGMRGPHGMGRHGHGGPGFGFGPGMNFGKLSARLQLTPEQKDKLKSIMKQHMQENKGQGEAARNAHEALAKELFKDQPNQAEIQRQVAVLQQEQAQRMAQWVSAAQEMNKVLTPEQRAEVQKIIDENHTARAAMKQKMEQRRQQWQQKKGTAPQTQPPAAQ